ncbi:MAG: transglutaminase-like domain-containing protein [Myxococcota bacterium]|nr:transglutaminase-like domain-containing protein [Myxococcota bacterium]
MLSRALPYVESISFFVWLILAGYLFFQSGESDLKPLTAEALQASSSEERWNGIFFQEQHVGYSVARTSELEDGSLLMEQRSIFRVATFGQLQKIVTAGAALSDPSGALRRFDFFMASGDITLSAKGEVRGNQILMEVNQGGEVNNLSFDIKEPPHVSLSLEAAIRKQELSIGKKFSLPYFDPVTMSQQDMSIKVIDSEILENGEEAWWIQTSFAGIMTRSLVSPTGDLLRQEGGALGISIVRMSPADAQNVPTQKEPVDLIALSAVPLKGKLKKPRNKTILEVEVSGIDIQKLPHRPPIQIVSGKNVRIEIPNINQIQDEPIATTDKESPYLEETLTLPVSHSEIRNKANEVIGQSQTRMEAAQKLNTFVYDYMEKIPSIGVPNGLQSLRQAKGDCNEHTALYVSMARSIGIPSRIAAGLVFSDRTGPIGQFYYHAWPEVLLGEHWIPIDPTFGQFPADATHIKITEGDLDRQVEIMGFLGQISLILKQAE